jgi:hypothetical protein
VFCERKSQQLILVKERSSTVQHHSQTHCGSYDRLGNRTAAKHVPQYTYNGARLDRAEGIVPLKSFRHRSMCLRRNREGSRDPGQTCNMSPNSALTVAGTTVKLRSKRHASKPGTRRRHTLQRASKPQSLAPASRSVPSRPQASRTPQMTTHCTLHTARTHARTHAPIVRCLLQSCQVAQRRRDAARELVIVKDQAPAGHMNNHRITKKKHMARHTSQYSLATYRIKTPCYVRQRGQ